MAFLLSRHCDLAPTMGAIRAEILGGATLLRGEHMTQRSHSGTGSLSYPRQTDVQPAVTQTALRTSTIASSRVDELQDGLATRDAAPSYPRTCAHEAPRRNRARDDGARSDHRVTADGDPPKDDSLGGDPRTIPNLNRRVVVSEARATAIVATGAQECLLGDANVATDHNWLEIQEPSTLANPGVPADS